MTIRPWAAAKSEALHSRAPRGGRGTPLRGQGASLGPRHPAGGGPGRGAGREAWGQPEGHRRKQRRLRRPSPGGDGARRRPPRSPFPPRRPLDRRPAAPLPGTQGSPAGSRPELHSRRARSSASPLPGPAPLPPRGPLPAPRRRGSHRTRQPRAPPPSPAPEPGARPCAAHCACARAPLRACSVSPPGPKSATPGFRGGLAACCDGRGAHLAGSFAGEWKRRGRLGVE